MEWVMAHGPALVFLFSLLNSLSVPVPCSPVLIVAGGLVFKGLLHGPLLLFLAAVGGLLGRLPWYWLGRRNGPGILHAVCTFSLDRPSCIGKMEDLYRQHGPKILLVARFIPGLTAVAAPMAGAARLPLGVFALLELGGAAIYSLVLMLSGIFLGDWAAELVKRPPDPSVLVTVVSAGLLVYIVYKAWLRFQEKLAPSVPRVSLEDVRRMQSEGVALVFVDTRGAFERENDPYAIPGSVPAAQVPGGLCAGAQVVTYCSCPLEASAAQLALKLRKQGWSASPLKGGWESWKAANLAQEALTSVAVKIHGDDKLAAPQGHADPG